jgi:ribonuclease D
MDPAAASVEQSVAFTLVASQDAYREMLEALHPAARIAVDIEADSLYHYFEKVCLIQISSDRRTYVLDTLAVRDLGELAPIFADARVEKVFHASSYDIYCLRRDYGFTFERIFDTHVAAQLSGFEQLGLSALLETLLGVSHSKRRQRDDWSRRPLETEQLQYAAMDTHHLLTLRDILEQNLEAKGRLSWALEEFQVATRAVPPERVFDPEGFRRIKGSRELRAPESRVLRALFALRDQIARELDVPPFKVLNNATLVELARRPPARPAGLLSRPGVSFRVARRWATEICSVAQRALLDESATPAFPRKPTWEPPPAEVTRRIELLKKWRARKSEELGLHVGVVFPGNLFEQLAGAPPADTEALAAVDGMRGWRVREFGAEILEILRSA